MASESKKRKLDAGVLAQIQRAKKRKSEAKKLNGAKPTAKPAIAKSGSQDDSTKLMPAVETPGVKSQIKKAKSVSGKEKLARIDQLNWSSVPMPEQLDDFEGFFGLEEVDDVEVVKDEETGAVSFKALDSGSKDKAQEKSKSQGGTYDLIKNALANGTQSNEQDQHVDDIEFGGFEDSPPVEDAAAEASPIVEKANSKEKPQKKTRKERRQEAKESRKRKAPSDEAEEEEGNETDDSLVANVFANLEEEDLGSKDVDISAWQPLKLSPETMGAIAKLGFASPTQVQSRCIPDIVAGHDVVGKAATGSGKTLAFGIPILEYYLDSVLPEKEKRKEKDEKNLAHHPTALILAPTRELAHQLSKHLLALCEHLTVDRPRIACITGGLSVQKQKRQLESADILIGTPGRLWEVIESSIGLVEKLKQIRFLVVDEADRLLSEGHFKEVEQILTALDRVTKDEEQDENEAEADDEGKRPRRQTLVFSATFHKGLQQKLAGKSKGADLMSNQQSMEYLLKKLNFREEKPKFIDVNPVQQMAQGLREGLIECAGTEKDLYLYALLLLHPKTRTLVFTNSISAVRRITPFLQNLNQPAQALHSNMIQKARLRAVERFTASDSSILIATDVAARGLDIAGVQLVIHYHVPRAADMYIHRSGRTARATAKGSSILICAPEEVQGVRRLIAKVHAQSADTGEKRAIRTLDLDRRIIARLKPRATLAKKIADVALAKEKSNSTDKVFEQAAEDLGVDYDSEEFEAMGGGGRQGRGNKRKEKQREDRQVTKAEVGALKAELKALLAQRVNTGISPKYITGGGSVDIDALLRGEKGEFLGAVTPLDMLGADDSD